MSEGKFEPNPIQELQDLPSDDQLQIKADMIADEYAERTTDAEKDEVMKASPKYFQDHFGEKVIRVTFDEKGGKPKPEEMTIAQWQTEHKQGNEHSGGE